MLTNFKVSYVIPTLNSAETLEYTLLSLKSQNDVELNIIVVDSGSTDATLEICKRWGVNTMYAEPGNMYEAINLGLSKCDGEWLGYINSDDWLYRNSIAKLIRQGIKDKADIVYGNCDYTDEDGRFVHSLLAADPTELSSLFRLAFLGFAQQSAIFSRSVYQKLNGFDERFSFCADLDFYSRAANLGFDFTYLPSETVSCFRIHKNQLSNTKSQEMILEKRKIFDFPNKNKSYFDKLSFIKWRLKNLPNYALRLIRQSCLAGEITLTKSVKF